MDALPLGSSGLALGKSSGNLEEPGAVISGLLENAACEGVGHTQLTGVPTAAPRRRYVHCWPARCGGGVHRLPLPLAPPPPVDLLLPPL